jgi:hypothetical protein
MVEAEIADRVGTPAGHRQRADDQPFTLATNRHVLSVP